MKVYTRTVLAFCVTTKPVNPSLKYGHTSFICSNSARQAINRRRKPHYQKPSLANFIASATRGAPAMVIEDELTLTSNDHSQVGAYFVRPEEHAVIEGRGVILMTDILGFKNNDTRSVAKRFAEAGLPIIVPDLFRGEPWTQGRSMTEYESWRSQHDPARIREDMKTAHSFLIGNGFASRLGMIGFCFGGGRTMEEIALASEGINPKVAVTFYPTRFDPESVGRNATCSLLFISGDKDELVPLSVIEKLQETVGEEGCQLKDCEMQIVEGAGHAFAHHPKTEQNEVDGEMALNRAVRYLTTIL